MKYLIDYFMFVLKPDKHAQNPYPDKISLGYILDLLGLNEEFANFVDIGSHLHYEKCYCYQNIRIYCPYSSDFDVMGYCIEMSGSGCRFFESLFGALTFRWKDFFLKLRNCVTNGLSLNINRVDFAFDDYDKKLDLSKIEECAKKREYVSLFRSVKSVEDYEKINFQVQSDYSTIGIGKTIYFGSRKSNCFCRFYDKLVEQKKRNSTNPAELKLLENINHWIRFEIVFKHKTAIRIVNSILELSDSDFSSYLSTVINTYLRFINLDDSNPTRCSLKTWWVDFIGSCERSTLTTLGIKTNPLKRFFLWFSNSVAPSLHAFLQNPLVGETTLINLIRQYGDCSRWRPKHQCIATIPNYFENVPSNHQVWLSEIPLAITNNI